MNSPLKAVILLLVLGLTAACASTWQVALNKLAPSEYRMQPSAPSLERSVSVPVAKKAEPEEKPAPASRAAPVQESQGQAEVKEAQTGSEKQPAPRHGP